jgi:hypothetical protein
VNLSRSRVIGVGLALVVGAAVVLLWPRQELSVEEIIQQKIVAMTHAAQEKDVAKVMEDVSESFKGGQGMKKEQVRGVLLSQVLRGQWVRIFTTELSATEVSPTRGDFTVKFIFHRSEAQTMEELTKESVLNAFEIQGSFEKEQDGEWRVVEARHRQVAPTELF